METLTFTKHPTMNDRKICQCCASTDEDLRSISEPHMYDGHKEIYSQMLSACFAEVKITEGFICGKCASRLRAALTFRRCVESTRTLFVHLKKEQSSKLKTIFEDSDKNDSTSESSVDNFDIVFNTPQEIPKRIKNQEKFEIGEMRTLPYVLDNTDRTCEICQKQFSFTSQLVKHMPEHYPNYLCEICGRICVTRKSLIVHLKTHIDSRLECNSCDKIFKSKFNLNHHIKVKHKGQKTLYKCNQCGEIFNSYYIRIKHMTEKHGREDKSFKCPQCSRRYHLSSQLRRHVRRVHLQEKNYKCAICGMSFFTKPILANHSIKHSGEKNFVCPICHKKFARRDSLKCHQKIHEGMNDIPIILQTQCKSSFV